MLGWYHWAKIKVNICSKAESFQNKVKAICVSGSDQSVSPEYSGFSNIIPKPKLIKVEDYTRTHLPEIPAHHHFLQDVTTAAPQALLQICMEFTLYKNGVCCSRIPLLSLYGWILGIITMPLLIFYTVPRSNLLRDYQNTCPAMSNHFMN